ncbi:hypothetical protein Tco_1448418 [Tanacetum coccineum]
MIPQQARRDKAMKKKLRTLLASISSKLYKPSTTYPSNFLNPGTRLKIPHKETVGSPVVQQNGIQCFNCRDLEHYARDAGSQSGLKTTRITKRRCDVQNKLKQDGHHIEEYSSLVQTLEQIALQKTKNEFEDSTKPLMKPGTIDYEIFKTKSIHTTSVRQTTALSAIKFKDRLLEMTVNTITKKPNVVTISARNPRVTIKELYEIFKSGMEYGAIAKRCPSGYTWTQKPLRTKDNGCLTQERMMYQQIVTIILFIDCLLDCSNANDGQFNVLCNFVEKFLGPRSSCDIKRQIMTTLTRAPRQNVVQSAEKTDLSHQGVEFSLQSFLEDYYNQHTVLLRKTT